MAVSEIDSFVSKFKYLWHAGFDATLKVDTNAGQAWVSLQAGLGHPFPPLHLPQYGRHVQCRSGPAQQWRSEKREAARSRAAGNEENNEVVGDPAVEAEPSTNVAAEEAADLVNDDVSEEATAEEEVGLVSDNEETAAAEAGTDFKCDQCEKMFASTRGLKAHEGRKHKATGSPIPQLDGQSERLDDYVIYTFVSEFHLEDIEYTLREIFPEDVKARPGLVKAILMSRVKVIGRGPRSADHICTLRLELPGPQIFSWPAMTRDQAEVFKDIQKQ